MPIHVDIYLSISLFIYIHLSLNVHLSIYPSIYLSVFLIYICIYIYLCVCMYVYSIYMYDSSAFFRMCVRTRVRAHARACPAWPQVPLDAKAYTAEVQRVLVIVQRPCANRCGRNACMNAGACVHVDIDIDMHV